MNENITNYFSHKLEFNLNRNPAKISDRTNWCFLLPGMIFGGLLFLLGLYEMLNGFKYTNPNVSVVAPIEENFSFDPLINPLFFDIVFMIIGLGMIVSGVFSYLRYRKFIFDGKKMFIGYRPVFGTKRIVNEPIKNYLGVRFRIAFYQFGLINSNKYIIELYHKDPRKIVPLYVSTSPVSIRKKWKEYARFFNLPALINTDEGLISRDLKNLDKSVKEMSKMGFVIDNYDTYEEIPSPLTYARRKDKIVIKRKIIWDIYNIIVWFFIFSLVAAVSAVVAKYNFEFATMPTPTYGFLGTCIALILVAVFILFRKEKLVIKKHKLVHTHKYMLFSTKHNEMLKEDIESIEVSENPATGRYFVSIISDNNTIAFGAKLPSESLRWIKRFLIHEVIK
ncbi:MAG: hypothetical protein E7019_02760 [Alphaproteobacteria bacterium]|nr:hypothetical protein [Alphaproteobacteria bacterium]